MDLLGQLEVGALERLVVDAALDAEQRPWIAAIREPHHREDAQPLGERQVDLLGERLLLRVGRARQHDADLGVAHLGRALDRRAVERDVLDVRRQPARRRIDND